MAEINKNTNNSSQEQSDFNILDFLYDCMKHWYLFVLAIGCCLAVAVLYLSITHPKFSASSVLVIKQDRRTGSSGLELNSTNFANMGSLFSSQTNVNNEILAFKSPDFMRDVVNKLDLRANYSKRHHLYQKTIYGAELPFTVKMVDFPASKSVAMKVRYVDENSVDLVDMTTWILDEKIVTKGPLRVNLKDTVETPIGRMSIKPSIKFFDVESMGEDKPFEEIHFSYSSLAAATNSYCKRLSVELTGKETTAITLSLSDRSAQRAIEVLSSLIDTYEARWMDDRNKVALTTSKFINSRLAVIERELGDVDNDISQFKSNTGLLDPQAMSSLFLEQNTKYEDEILKLQTSMKMAEYIRDYMASSNNTNQLLPANSGLDNTSIETQIAAYNNQQLKRNNLVANSSESSPIVVSMDAALRSMHSAIMASIDNYMQTLKAQINSMEETARKTTQKISMNPMQVERLTDIQRQQMVKESLYLYLLQKREENELSQEFTANNTRVLTEPYSTGLPESPKKMQIILIALLFGLAIPAGALYLVQMMNTKVKGRKDIAMLSIPFLGEIPLAYKRQRFDAFRKSQDKNMIVVKKNSRNVVNEAFRVARANLEMMCGQSVQEGKGITIQSLSLNAGSGKTFIVVNLALALTLKGKKVCAIDLDIRKANLSKYVGNPKKGIVDYLLGRVDDIASLKVQLENSSLDIYPVGPMPPNPTELLYDQKLEKLINALRKEYDYVFIDSTPVNIVADAAIVNKFADRSLMMVRAGLLEKELLPEIESYYVNKTYNGMMLLLNGTEIGNGYGYGKRYGYGYGYGYGSSYGYGEDNKK